MTHFRFFTALSAAALATTLLATPATAQIPITLTAAGHQLTAGRVYYWQQLTPPTGSLAQLVAAGPNQTWDFRPLALRNATFSNAWTAPPANPAYPQATVGARYEERLGLSHFEGYRFLGYTAEGLVQFGSGLAQQAVSLGSATLNPNDSLFFPAQALLFTPPLVMQELPSTVGSVVSQFRRVVTNVRVTVHNQGLRNAPAQYVQRFTRIDSVIAWGTLQIPLMLHAGGSAPIPVLVRRSIAIEQDSFYLAGQLAPSPLLSAVTVSQGATTTTWTDAFLRDGSPQPVAVITYTRPNRSQGIIQVSAESTIPLGTPALVAAAAATLWPNPARAGQALRLTVDGLTAPVLAILTDPLGRTVLTTTLHPGAESLPLPAILVPGAYQLTATLPDGRRLHRRVAVE